MPIKIFDTKELVPEALRETAIETKEGKFAVEDPELGAAGLAALQKEREDKAREKTRADAAERERDTLKREKEARESGVSEAELQRIRDAEEAARKPILDENAVLKAENIKLKLTDRVQALFLKFGGLADRTEDAMDQLVKRTGLGDEGGIIFKDKDGKVTTDSAEIFFPKFKTEKPYYFSGTGASGSGGSGSNGSGGGDELPKPNPEALAAKSRAIASAF